MSCISENINRMSIKNYDDRGDLLFFFKTIRIGKCVIVSKFSETYWGKFTELAIMAR